MKKSELQQTAIELVKELNKTYPKTTNDAGQPLTKVVEYNGVKYDISYGYSTDEIRLIYKNGDNESLNVFPTNTIVNQPELNILNTKQLSKIISVVKEILKGIEIQDGPILQVVENNKTIPYYSATMRLECEIDFQIIMGVVAELNQWYLDKDKGYMILVDEYKGQRTTMGSAFAKLSIHSDLTINDIKAILLNYELPDCHIAIQSLDYAQFDGLRDRSSQYPSHELVEKWAANKLTIK